MLVWESPEKAGIPEFRLSRRIHAFWGQRVYVLGSLQLDLTKHLLRRIATEADVIGLPFFQVTRLCDGHSSVRKNLTIC
jgi:hypothetical protein